MPALTLFDENVLPQFAAIERYGPQEIEAASMRAIAAELSARGIVVPAQERARSAVIFRAIHASADFDYATNLVFSDGVLPRALSLLRERHPVIVTDTNRALTGISKNACARLGIRLHCFMADDDVAAVSRRTGLTRAACSVDKAARLFSSESVDTPAEKPSLIFAVGNAPTALVRIRQLYDAGLLAPAFVVGVPVGFVNVVAAKELICASGIPHIVARGRKGGSAVAAAIINALLYVA